MRKFKYIILLITLFISSFCTFLFLDSKYNTATKNISKEANITLNNNSTTDYYIFLGDSITAGFNLESYFNNENYINQGIKGDTISKVMERLNDTTSKSPKKIFLMIGINDLSSYGGINPTIKENYKNLIEAIINRSTDTELYLESVLPVSNEKYDGLNEDIMELNSYIQDIAKDKNLTYIDVWSKFYDGDDLISNLSNDGLHPNKEGYGILYSVLDSYL